MPNLTQLPAPDVAIPASAAVGEGPVVDHRTGRLCWVDITEGIIHESDLDTGADHAIHLDTMLGAAAPRQDEEGFAVAVSEGFGFVTDGRLVIADPCLPEAERRMNDAKCDSHGRLWAGSNHMDFEPGYGALHRWDGAASSVALATGFTLPNGLGWSPDDRTMYLVDSMDNTLLQADFHPAEGEVGDFVPLCRVEPGLPDGLTVDADGFIWIAVWKGSEVRRFNPAGALVAVVPLPVGQVTSCAFGDDDTLFITTARLGLSEAELAGQPHAGSVFAVSTGTLGASVSPFAR